jgi:hypothetical protein
MPNREAGVSVAEAARRLAAAYTGSLTRAFLSPAAISAFSPHQSRSWSAHERSRLRLNRLDVVRVCRANNVPGLSLLLDRDDGEDPGRCQLLAVQDVRRGVERVAPADQPVRGAAVAMSRGDVVRELMELIAALDRRLPQVQRAGEASIAHEAAALKARALKRIEELEREPAHGAAATSAGCRWDA